MLFLTTCTITLNFLPGFSSSPGWLLVTRTRAAWWCHYRGHWRSGPTHFYPRSRVCAQEWHCKDIHSHIHSHTPMLTPKKREKSFIPGDSNWKYFQVGYPVDTHTNMNLLLRVSVTYRPALARSILGRWKERSLRMKPPSLPIVQGISRPTKGIRNTFWHTADTQCKNENKGEKPPSLETLQKKKGKSTEEAKNIHKSSRRMNSEQRQKRKN